MGPIGEEEVKPIGSSTRRAKIGTVPDFLEMIIQQNVQIIIMMTLPQESNGSIVRVMIATNLIMIRR